jgi:hypothetical protein
MINSGPYYVLNAYFIYKNFPVFQVYFLTYTLNSKQMDSFKL